jgi:hypothetical protein
MMDDAKRDQILLKIIDSLIENPNQTPTERSLVTHRIAAREGVDVMVVAGVRAAFTRETYGVPRLLIRKRKTALKKAAS